MRNISLYARPPFRSPSTYSTTPIPPLLPLAASTRSTLSFYSSESSELSSPNPHKHLSDDDVTDVSSEELKKRIDKYFEGDVEAIPSIFEAILQRKLAGLMGKKNDDNDDDKLIEELCGKKELREESESDVEDKEVESDCK